MSQSSPQAAGPPELPGYRFLSHIGAGGNAQVYLYEQELPSRKVAVKVLNDSVLSDAARRRFTTEANVTAVLAHRHIVQVFDAKVTDDGRPYIVMPFYPRPNLAVRARRAHFSVAEVLRIGIQIGSAVETSHRHGVLHRDIKPQNILTDAYGEPALTDFGIATTTAGDGPEGLSVPWSPPEILVGTGPGDRRSDVYSLGATLWHLLAGRPPFEQPDGGNTTGVLKDRIRSVPPQRTQRSDVPDSLERLLRQTMAKDPASRPQSAIELIRGLQSIEQELRLPLTQPILPASEPARGHSRGGDTVARPAARGSETASSAELSIAPMTPADPGHSAGPADGIRKQESSAPGEQARSQPAWAADTVDVTIAHGGGRPAMSPPAAAGSAQEAIPAGHDADQPVRHGRSMVPQSRTAVDVAARDRGPVVLDPRGGAAEQDAVEKVTARRAGHSWTWRMPAFAVGGVVLATGAVLGIVHGGGSSGPAAARTTPPASSGGLSTVAPPAPPAPGQPTVTAHRVSASQVEFRWTYANPASHDTFRWLLVGGGSGAPGGTVPEPEVFIASVKGQDVCITVIVRRADGQASPPSSSVCSTN